MTAMARRLSTASRGGIASRARKASRNSGMLPATSGAMNRFPPKSMSARLQGVGLTVGKAGDQKDTLQADLVVHVPVIGEG